MKVVVFPASFASHWFSIRPTVQELSARGHSLKVVFSEDAVAKYGPSVAHLPSVDILSYNTTWSENDVREYVRQMSRTTGLASIAKDCGIPWHSHPLLQDKTVFAELQAAFTACDALPLMQAGVSA